MQNTTTNPRENAKVDTVIAIRPEYKNGTGSQNEKNAVANNKYKTVSHNVINFGGGGGARRTDRLGTVTSNQNSMNNSTMFKPHSISNYQRSNSKKPSFVRVQSRAHTKKSTFFTVKNLTIEEKESVD